MSAFDELGADRRREHVNPSEELAAALDALAAAVQPAGHSGSPPGRHHDGQTDRHEPAAASQDTSSLGAGNLAGLPPSPRRAERALAPGALVAWPFAGRGESPRWQYGIVQGLRKRDGYAWARPFDAAHLAIRIPMPDVVLLLTAAEAFQHAQSVHASL